MQETRTDINAERCIDYQTTARLTVTNDTLCAVNGTVCWELREASGQILKSGQDTVSIPAQSVFSLPEMDFCKCDAYNTYLSYHLVCDGTTVSEGTVLFAAPKHFRFQDPHLRYERNGDTITVYADGYAKSVEIDSPDSDFVLSDNYFDMNGGSKTVKILEGNPKTVRLRSDYDIR